MQGGGRLNRIKKVASISIITTFLLIIGILISSFLFVFGAPAPAGANTLTCTPAEGGYITINGVKQECKTYDVGTIPSGDLVAVPNSGYKFVKWLVYTDGGYSTYTTQTLSSSNRNDSYCGIYECVFEITGIQIDVSTDETMGSVSGGGVFSEDGTDSATLIATANKGYQFDHWENSSGTVVSYNSNYTFTVTQADTYTAVFRSVAIIITTSNSGSEISSQTVDNLNTSNNYSLKFNTSYYITQIQFSGDSAPRTLTSSNGVYSDISSCTTLTYYTNTTGSEMYLSILNWHGDEDLVITLYFANAAQNYKSSSGGGIDTVAVQSTLGGSVELLGDDYANLADTDTVTLVARIKITGYQFDGWFVQGESTAFATDFSVRVAYGNIKDKIIIARFSLINSNINTDTDNDNEFV